MILSDYNCYVLMHYRCHKYIVENITLKMIQVILIKKYNWEKCIEN